MRIALLTDGIFPYVLGGMQRHSFFLAKYLAHHKVHVDIIHCNQSDFDIAKLEYFTEEEKKYLRSVVLVFPPAGKIPGHYLRESYQYSCSVFEAIKDRLDDFDFIYVKGFSGWKLLKEKKKGLKCPPREIRSTLTNIRDRP